MKLSSVEGQVVNDLLVSNQFGMTSSNLKSKLCHRYHCFVLMALRIGLR